MQTVQHEKRPEDKSKVLPLPSTLLTAIFQNINSIKINTLKKKNSESPVVTSAIYLHSFNPCLMKCKLWEPSLYMFLKDRWVIFFKKHEKLDICYKFQTIYHLGILCCKDWWHQIITPSVTSARFSSLFLVNCYIKKMLSKIFFHQIFYSRTSQTLHVQSDVMMWNLLFCKDAHMW